MRPNTNRREVSTAVVAVLVISSLVAGAGVAATESSSAERDADVGAMATASENSAWSASENSAGMATQTENGTNVSVRNLSAPDQIRPGESFTVTATIDSADDRFTVRRVVYRIAGNVLAAKWVSLPNGATKTVSLNVSADRTSGLPNGTFTHGVSTRNTDAAAELAITSGGTTAADQRATASDEQSTDADQQSTDDEGEPTNAESEPADAGNEPTDAVRIRIAVNAQPADGPIVTVESAAGSQNEYVVFVDQRLHDELVRLLADVWASVNGVTAEGVRNDSWRSNGRSVV